ncbi:MAG: alpha-ribazole phosphatase [Pseudomonadota bacterium]
MPLILLRHTTPLVAEGTCYGRTDLPLTETFEQEAEQVIAELPKIAKIVSSPLQRCRRLADAVGQARGLAVTIEPNVTEMDFGTWEGRLWSDIPRQDIDQWAGDFLHGRPHGGESVAMLRARVVSALAAFSDAPEPILIVTHSGVIRAALAKGDTADHFNTQIDFGGFISMPTEEFQDE